MKLSTAIPLALLALFASGCGGVDPAAALAEGQASLAAHEYRAAMIHALNLLEAEPENIEARLLLGRASLELGEIADAGTHLGLARDAGAPLEEYAVALASAHARAGQVDEALAILDSLGESHRDADYFSLYAGLLIGGGDLERAAQMLEAGRAADADDPARAESIAVESRLYQARGDLAAAEEAVSRALAIDGNNPEIWAFAASLASRAGDLALAESRLLTAIGMFEQRLQVAYAAPSLLELVRIQLAQGRIEPAEATVARLQALQSESAAANFAAGLVAYDKGEYEAAVDNLRRAAAAAPNNLEVLTVLGAAHLANGSLGQAEQQLAAVAAESPTTATIRLLAETRLRRNQPDDALDALALLPADAVAGDSGLATLQSAALIAEGRSNEAIAVLERARGLAPADAGLTLQLARAYLVAGRADEASALINSSTALSADATFASNLGLMLARLETDGAEAARSFVAELAAGRPDSAAIELVAGTLEFLTGNRREAEARIAAALRIDPEFVPAYLLTASVEIEAGRTREAEASLRQALSVAPGHPGASAGLARLRAAEGDLDGAMAILVAVPTASAPIEVLSLQGALALDLADLPMAEAVAASLRQRFPLRAAGHSLQGQIETAHGRNAAAATAFAAAYELEPAYGTLQSAVSSARRAGSASWKRLLDERLAAAPDDAVTRMMLADALLGEARQAEALAEYREVLERDASNATALNNAAWLAHELGQPGALDFARRGKAVAPGNPAVLDTLGWLLTETDRAADGLPELEEAARLAPDVPEIRYHLAVAQARTGQVANARATLERVLGDPAGTSVHEDARQLLESL